jgi:hypothetical protein
MKVGIGYDNNIDSFLLGSKVAENAMQQSNINRPDLVFAFCGGRVDHGAFLKGMRIATGDKVPVIGGSAAGIITNDNLSYEGWPAGAAVIESDTLEHMEAVVGNLDKDERLAGRELAEKLSSAEDSKLMVIFYDSLKHLPTATTPPILNASPPLIMGISEKLKSNIPIVGAGVIGDHELNSSELFCCFQVDRQSVVGTMLGGQFKPYHRIMHGCTPQDGIYHTVTKIDGPFLYELDGRPVVGMIDDMYGNRDWREQVPVRRLTIGVNHGEKYEEYKEENIVNRLIVGTLPEGEGIVLFEPDLDEGSQVLFMLRNGTKMIESAKRNSIELMEQIASEGKKPVFGLYIDCAGRTAGFSNTIIEEASEVQKVLNQHNTPLLGFYSGVEIAPFLGKSRGLDWTGVLLVLAEG